MIREKHIPSLRRDRDLDGTRNSEHWVNISLAVVCSICSSIVQSTIYVVLALGPLVTIGMGQGAYGSILAVVGLLAVLTQLVLYPKLLLPRYGLQMCGVLGSLLYLAGQIAWMRIDQGISCVTDDGTPDGDNTKCMVASASAADLFYLAVGTCTFAVGYTLTQVRLPLASCH